MTRFYSWERTLQKVHVIFGHSGASDVYFGMSQYDSKLEMYLSREALRVLLFEIRSAQNSVHATSFDTAHDLVLTRSDQVRSDQDRLLVDIVRFDARGSADAYAMLDLTGGVAKCFLNALAVAADIAVERPYRNRRHLPVVA